MIYTTTCHKIQSSFFSWFATNSMVEKSDPLKGFFPIMKDYIRNHTSSWFKDYKWQVGHPLRKMGVDKLGGSIIGYIASKLSPSVCTLTAYNVFSIFVEHSERKSDRNFDEFMLREKQEGIDQFKNLIDKVQESKVKGMACFCAVGAPWAYDHEFVVEVAPGGDCYIYQSYIYKYTLKTCFNKMVPLTVDGLIEQLKCVTNYELHPPASKESQAAFKKLFFADRPPARLDFFFTPVEYSIDSIPLVPRTSSFAERMVEVWRQFIAILSKAFKLCLIHTGFRACT